MPCNSIIADSESDDEAVDCDTTSQEYSTTSSEEDFGGVDKDHPDTSDSPAASTKFEAAVRKISSCLQEPRGNGSPGSSKGSENSSHERITAKSDADTTDDDAEVCTQEDLDNRKAANILALQNNSLNVCRKPIARALTVHGQESVLQAFKSPVPGTAGRTKDMRRLLANIHVPRPWGGGEFKSAITKAMLPPVGDDSRIVPNDGGPPPGEPLVLWKAPEGSDGGIVDVDPQLTRWLRPHQREGVQFMFDCVLGLRQKGGFGCILADDMGLGKTLQGISLLWTLLQGGHELLGATKLAKRVIIVCPTSLVGNWDSECQKWLKGRPLRTLPLCEASRADVTDSISQFLSPQNYYQVLIVSYETFRLHADRMRGNNACDLLICDEAHRLKNDATLTNKALDGLACKRRVLLSGTPMQNHLDEFYAMVSFCNPQVLGTPAEFRKRFERPILEGREPGAPSEVADLATERSTELSRIVNDFILRRTNTLLSAHLPPKVIEIVCCRMTSLQQSVYEHFTQSEAARRILKVGDNGKSKSSPRVLSAITALKKLCNHPKLIYDAIYSNTGNSAEGFEGCKVMFQPGMFDGGRPGRGGMCVGWEALSGKMAVAASMLALLRTTTSDRIVIVSNYTQTLDMFEALCRQCGYPFLRLDGTTSISKRQKLVKRFNDPAENQFVFLLSSKAGGCGLNLIGGNRLILYDPDWNPATDKQAAARVWRDGQKKRVFVYRFLTTGTIEEKVYQRQLSKEGLQSLVNSASTAAGGAGSEMNSNNLSTEDLRDLFTLQTDTKSDTYDSICCRDDEIQKDGAGPGTPRGCPQPGAEDDRRPGDVSPSPVQEPVTPMGRPAASQSALEFANGGIYRMQIGAPAEEDLKKWGHHSSPATVPDSIMAQADPDIVSFVFSCQVAGKEMPPEPATPVAQLRASAPAAANVKAATTPSSRLAGGRVMRGTPMSAVGPPLNSLRASAPAAGSAMKPVMPRGPHTPQPWSATSSRRPLASIQINAPSSSGPRKTLKLKADSSPVHDIVVLD